MATKELTVKKIEAVTVGKMVGAFNGILGVVAGAFSAIVAIISIVANNEYGVMGDIVVSLGILLAGIIVYPIIAYALGWVYGWLLGLVFNVVAGVGGGVGIVVDDNTTAAKSTPVEKK